jgi:hypothetical protein
MAKNVSALFGETHVSGETPSCMTHHKRKKSYLIEGVCTFDDTYRLHILEYETATTPKGDRKFDIELDIDAFDQFLQIIKLYRR